MFKSREELKSKQSYKDSILEDLKNLESSVGIDSDKRDTKVVIKNKQREFFWIRVYLKKEDEAFEPGDEIILNLKPKNETLKVVFGSYEKKGLYRDFDKEVVSYQTEEDKKVLCCMVDYEKINKDSEDIPNLRTFFKSSKYYQENLFLKEDFIITHKGRNIEYTSLSL